MTVGLLALKMLLMSVCELMMAYDYFAYAGGVWQLELGEHGADLLVELAEGFVLPLNLPSAVFSILQLNEVLRVRLVVLRFLDHRLVDVNLKLAGVILVLLALLEGFQLRWLIQTGLQVLEEDLDRNDLPAMQTLNRNRVFDNVLELAVFRKFQLLRFAFEFGLLKQNADFLILFIDILLTFLFVLNFFCN